MELRHLRYFLAVAEDLSFTRAAKRLYVGQPTLSQQIQAVEKIIGGPLFHRDPGGVQLTEVGRALVGPAQQTLAAAEEALAQARSAAKRARDTLRVGLFTGSTPQLTNAILAAFVETFPEARLLFHQLNIHELCFNLLDSDIDVALTRLPLDRERFRWRELHTERRIICVGPNHPLTEASVLSVTDLLDYPMSPAATPRDSIGVLPHWRLNSYRNGDDPPLGGPPVTTLFKGTYAISYGGVIGVGVESFRDSPFFSGLPIRFVDLSGVSDSTAVVACRRTDQRPLAQAFFNIASQTVQELALLHRAAQEVN